MSQQSPFNRITLIVLDGAGIGAMPDAPAWGDAGSDTFGHICESRQLHLPNLQSLGLGNIRPLSGVPPIENARGGYGKCALKSNGKDTTTGHWEMAGIILERAFPTYPNGFPQRTDRRIHREDRRARNSRQHSRQRHRNHQRAWRRTREDEKPIVYTSADSVFQIAAHEEVIPLDRLYEICEIARGMLRGEHEVGRVIARPFLGEPGSFYRTENRHDYAVPPPRENLLPLLSDNGLDVVSHRKDRFDLRFPGRDAGTDGEEQRTIDQSDDQALKAETRGLIFSNLVDFDMLYGHRRDTEGYARALEHFDARWPEIESAMRDGDLLMITADHGNDPTYPGTDHTREYAPLMVYGKKSESRRRSGNASVRCQISVEPSPTTLAWT